MSLIDALSGVQDRVSASATSVGNLLKAAWKPPKASTGQKQSTDPAFQNNPDYIVMIKQAQDTATIGTKGQDVFIIGAAPKDFQVQQQADWKAPFGAGLLGTGTIADMVAVATGQRLLAQVFTLKVWQGSTNDIQFTVTMEFRTWSDSDADVMQPLRNLLGLTMPSVAADGFLQAPGPIITQEALTAVGATAAKGFVAVTKDVVGGIGGAFGSLTGSSYSSSSSTTNGASNFVATATKAAANVATDVGNTAKQMKDAVDKGTTNKCSITIGEWFHLDNIVITDVQYSIDGQRIGQAKRQPMSATATVSFVPMFALTVDDIPTLLGGRQVQVTITE